MLGGVAYPLRVSLRSLAILEAHGEGESILLGRGQRGLGLAQAQLMLFALLPPGTVATPEAAGDLVGPADLPALMEAIKAATEAATPKASASPPMAPREAASPPRSSGPSPSTTAA